jgi:cell shape-determining protein MreC
MSGGARQLAIASLSPLWQKMAVGKPAPQLGEGVGREDLFVKSQMESMREWLLLEDRIAAQVDRLQELASFKMTGSELKEFFRLRGKQLISLIELSASSILAPVVFREPVSWSSYLWIGVGEKDNARLGRRIIAKNSPVVVGNALIGVVEDVGKSRSKVRLISDAHLVPSVRVVRGEPQNRFLLEHLEALLLSLEGREDLSPFFKEQKDGLLALRGYLRQDAEATYLAKGELHGVSVPLWRSRGKKMKGIGFNYDFADVFGSGSGKVSLLKKGDLLVTTGFDGIFPAGLDVAVVSSVHALREGSSSYELEATLAAGALEDVRHVFVLPPID